MLEKQLFVILIDSVSHSAEDVLPMCIVTYLGTLFIWLGIATESKTNQRNEW